MQKKRKLPIYAVLSIAFLIFCSTGFLLAPNDPKALTLFPAVRSGYLYAAFSPGY